GGGSKRHSAETSHRCLGYLSETETKIENENHTPPHHHRRTAHAHITEEDAPAFAN
ncbi:hypothetical protein FIBSPDRAFT_873488, partial [Athelia psychrophila]